MQIDDATRQTTAPGKELRKLEIPKPHGGVPTLGSATVLDRLTQQALLQLLQPQFDPEFSRYSYA